MQIQLLVRIMNKYPILMPAVFVRGLFSFVKKMTRSGITLHCIGDSHAEVFRYMAKRHMLLNTRLDLCVVLGASNMGLANPHSTTQAMPIFQKYIVDKVKPQDWVLFFLGEVDCGFVIWYRAKKYEIPVSEQFEISINNYIELIKFCVKKVGNDNIIICGVPLPTIKDGQAFGDVANKRLSIDANQKQRTELTMAYNSKLKEFCDSAGYRFLAYQNEILNLDTGLILNEFCNENSSDHHLASNKLASILTMKLKSIGLD